MPGIGPLLQMLRPGLTGMVAFSALVSYLTIVTTPSWSVALSLGFGILLLAASTSMLNQIQERNIDAKMARTCRRPLATGEMEINEALLLIAGCAMTGLSLLAVINAATALSALLVALLYNGLYTPLKRFSSFALLPGALSGALPVVTGWLAAGGSMRDPRIGSLVIFMVLWQIPHFICMAIRERDDYCRAGLALVPASVLPMQLVHLTRLWSVALVVGSLQLASIGLLQAKTWGYAAVAVAGWFLVWTLLSGRQASAEKFAQVQGRRLKLFLLLILGMLFSDVL